LTYELEESLDGSCGALAERGLELRKRLLDRIEVGRICRKNHIDPTPVSSRNTRWLVSRRGCSAFNWARAAPLVAKSADVSWRPRCAPWRRYHRLFQVRGRRAVTTGGRRARRGPTSNACGDQSQR